MCKVLNNPNLAIFVFVLKLNRKYEEEDVLYHFFLTVVVLIESFCGVQCVYLLNVQRIITCFGYRDVKVTLHSFP